MAKTFASFLAATSAATAATPEPTTAASTAPPVSAAMAWAPASVSQETRFSLPAVCSTMTRMSIAVLSSRFSENPNFVAQLVHQLLGNLAGGALEHLRLLGLLGNVKLFYLLLVGADRRLHVRH